MRRRRRAVKIGAAVGLLAMAAGLGSAGADTVRVLAAGAAQGAIRALEPAFRSASGHTVEAHFDTVGALRDRLLAGERADVLILSEAGVAALEKAGKLGPGRPLDLGSISVALAVRKGAPLPDVATPEALRRALLAARSVAHADPARGATAGTHFARVLERLGIAQEISRASGCWVSAATWWRVWRSAASRSA